jgi:hypothetical protein
MRTAEGNDALAWIDEQGNSVTESQYAILKAAECAPETRSLPRAENHHALVRKGVELIIREEKSVGGGLGRPSGARFRIYNRLKSYADSLHGTLFESEALLKAIDEIWMYGFVEEAERQGRTTAHRAFRRVLTETDKHLNVKYFILKSIIIGNLYGVDIIEEATEICKLRLFLKLVAHVERDDRRENKGLEPLPDIDFNIRAGNTLIGFTSLNEAKRATANKLDWEDGKALAEIEEGAREADHAYKRFREMQVVHGLKDPKQHEFKTALREHLATLAAKLDLYLTEVYGKNPHQQEEFEAWCNSHHPFNWFTEFYGIIADGGFDVIIGNPPYVSVAKIKYALPKSIPAKFPDIYAYIMMRCLELGNTPCRIGMIVPLSITFSEDFSKLRKDICMAGSAWFSSYDNIPASVFAGVSQRCTIWIGDHSRKETTHVSPMYRWRASYRSVLTSNINYALVKRINTESFGLPKLANASHFHILELIKAAASKPPKRYVSRDRMSRFKVGFSQAARNFISVFSEAPPCLDETTLRKVAPSKIGYVKVQTQETVFVSMAVLAGDVFFWYWLVRGDGFDITEWVVSGMLSTLNGLSDSAFKSLSSLGHLLHEHRNEALVFKKNAGKYVGNYNYHRLSNITRRADLLLLSELGATREEALDLLNYVQRVLAINEYAGEKGIPHEVKGKFKPGEVDAKYEAEVFDDIDGKLRAHYGLTDEELEFIINYDIKQRMGSAESEE